MARRPARGARAAVGDLAYTFRERWDDPTPLDHRNPWRLAARLIIHEPRHPDPLPPARDDPAPQGTHAVQVLRTYPANRPRYPFAPDGERSIARAYLKAFRRARRLVYLEDQYLWSSHAARALAGALQRNPELHVVAVVPRYPDRGGRATSAASRVGREYVTDILRRAGVAFDHPITQRLYLHPERQAAFGQHSHRTKRDWEKSDATAL